jgi:hypothetical protein
MKDFHSLRALKGFRGRNGCEMGEWVMSIYRAKKQRTYGPKGVRVCTTDQQFKGCFVRPSIIQRSIQKVVDVWYFSAMVYSLSMDVWWFQRISTLKDKSVRLYYRKEHMFALKDKSVRSVVSAYVHTKRQECTSTNPSVRPVQKFNFSKMPLWLILVTLNPN